MLASLIIMSLCYYDAMAPGLFCEENKTKLIYIKKRDVTGARPATFKYATFITSNTYHTVQNKEYAVCIIDTDQSRYYVKGHCPLVLDEAGLL